MLDFVFVDDLRLDPADLVPRRWDVSTTIAALEAVRTIVISAGDVSFEADELESPLRRLAEERGWKVGDLFMCIRVSITGRTATPPLFDTMIAIGPDRTEARLRAAADLLRRTTPEDAIKTQEAAHVPDPR
jgi:glutamyl-tRNA synthetase